MNTLQRGLWSGTIATSVMTIGFIESFRLLPEDEKSPVPPGTITNDLMEIAHLENEVGSESRQALAMLAHFGYGTAFAILYSALAQNSKHRWVINGTAFGLGVWGSSYLGLLPALGLRSQARKMTLKRNFMMIALHVLWGTTLGYTEEQLRKYGKEMFDGKLKKPKAE